VSPIKITGLSTKINGHTGVDKSLFRHHDKDPSLGDAKAVIASIPPDEYIPNYWDCEDRALFAISKVRCKHPCMPIGLAIGELADQNIIKGKHALVILWDKDFTRAEFYDPALKDSVEFTPEVIIPMPCSGVRRGEGIPKTEGLAFLNNGGAFVLDSAYNFSDEKIAAAKKFLVSGGLEECRGSTCPEFGTSYHNYDRVLNWFINFRKERALNGCPIGIAFGKWKKSEQAALIFWEKANENFSYWTVTAGKLSKEEAKNFMPTVIIV
jgi:hypothetical protein